ncbi:hypothetical protein ACFOYU_12980 [Microvirga sp. GCM10011540]|uniref:hypothetical protein n=1 Tax=Microvirga sp. GCM10011540 TaxID=3317338 RepID=UPI00360F16F9
MSGFVTLENRLPSLWQSPQILQVREVEASAPVVARDTPLPSPAAADQGSSERRDPSIFISHALRNAESLIASVTGLRDHEVRVSVSFARYDF